MEQWKDIVGFVGLYQVSNLGRVKRLSRPAKRIHPWTKKEFEYELKEKVLRTGDSGHGYRVATLMSSDGTIYQRYVHRLIVEAFIRPLKQGELVRHLNDVRDDNRLDNLAIGTYKDYDKYKKKNGNNNGNNNHGERNGMSKLKEDEVLQILSLHREGARQVDIARRFNVSSTTVWNIISGTTWSYLSNPQKHP